MRPTDALEHLEAEVRGDPSRPYLILSVLVLLGFSLYLACTRIYQVDEIQNAFMSRILGMGRSADFFTSAPLFLLGPLSWIAKTAKHSAELFRSERLVFLGLFWLNISLATLASGASFRTAKGLGCLLFLATLAPWWDYGFEIRHDNLILAWILAGWWVFRTRRAWGFWSLFAFGMAAIWLQCCTFKAFMYWLPLGTAIALLPPDGLKAKRWTYAGGWLAGLLAGAGSAALFYSATGLGSYFWANLIGSAGSAATAQRFWPWDTLARPLLQAPLWCAGCLALLWVGSMQLRASRHPSWDSLFPEWALVLGALGVILVNPTPFAYNLLLLVPLAAIGALRLLDVMDGAMAAGPWRVVAMSVMFSTHMVPFVAATWRHTGMDNDRQETLMGLAEQFTDREHDRVYDATGLVATRWPIDYHWFLHSLNIQHFRDGSWPPIEKQMASNPPAVVIASYRTDWLLSTDWTYIKRHYVPLADDFWVLGSRLPEGGGAWDCLHDGRYILLDLTAAGPVPMDAWTLDGMKGQEAILSAAKGTHAVAIEAGHRPIIVWLGPRLDELPRLSPSDHGRLFVNWY